MELLAEQTTGAEENTLTPDTALGMGEYVVNTSSTLYGNSHSQMFNLILKKQQVVMHQQQVKLYEQDTIIHQTH